MFLGGGFFGSGAKSTNTESTTYLDQSQDIDSENRSIDMRGDGPVLAGDVGGSVNIVSTDHGAMDGAMWLASDSVDSVRRLADTALGDMSSTVRDVLGFGSDTVAESFDFGRASTGQAFDFGGDAMTFVGDSVSGVFNFFEGLSMELVDLVGSSLESSENLAARSLDGAMSIKAGQTITEPANQTIREVAKYGVWAAGLAAAAYVAARALS